MSFAEIEYTAQPEPPAGLEGVTWGWRDLALGVFVALATFFVIGAAIIGTATAVYGKDSLEELFAEASSAILLEVVLVTTALLVIRRKGAGLRQLGFRRPKLGIVTKNNGPWMGLLGLVVVAYFGAIASVSF